MEHWKPLANIKRKCDFRKLDAEASQLKWPNNLPWAFAFSMGIPLGLHDSSLSLLLPLTLLAHQFPWFLHPILVPYTNNNRMQILNTC